jgi:hypothetical protein
MRPTAPVRFRRIPVRSRRTARVARLIEFLRCAWSTVGCRLGSKCPPMHCAHRCYLRWRRPHRALQCRSRPRCGWSQRVAHERGGCAKSQHGCRGRETGMVCLPTVSVEPCGRQHACTRMSLASDADRRTLEAAAAHRSALGGEGAQIRHAAAHSARAVDSNTHCLTCTDARRQVQVAWRMRKQDEDHLDGNCDLLRPTARTEALGGLQKILNMYNYPIHELGFLKLNNQFFGVSQIEFESFLVFLTCASEMSRPIKQSAHTQPSRRCVSLCRMPVAGFTRRTRLPAR